MPDYTQANRPMEVVTPLGKDVLLITGFHGEEGLSRPFRFHIDMVADVKKDIAFDKLLGQKATIRLNLANGKPRFFNGICSRFSQGESDTDFTVYRMEIVPQLWLLTKRAQTRIFQQMSVPDILKKVLTGLDVTYQIEGTFEKRNYCVQYRETDFNFVSRLMEDEGIFYFFTHAADGHNMVLANTPASHLDMPAVSKLTFEKVLSGALPDDRVLTWQKQQELVTGQHTLWDHKFELHGKNLETKKTLPDSVQVGKVTHKVKAGNADAREVYDYPGEYAARFDGVDPGGGDQAAEVQKIFKDNERVVGIRCQQEAVQSVTIHGTSTCRNLVSGHKFTLQKHVNADGDYVLTGLQHHTGAPVDYRTQGQEFRYTNTFTAIPFAMPFRPQRITPKPFVQGTQTAVVVGPPGEEIFCDKYGRVKVQFNWDREGKKDPKSSCWIRVATIWAGKGWGIVNVPRIGHEVIVGFEEGDPDQPIILGSVFNNDHMPPGKLPGDKMVSGLQSASTPGSAGYNGLIFNDTKKKELITLHGQHDMSTTIEHDDTQHIKNDRTINVDGKHTETIVKDTTITIKTGNYVHDVKTGTSLHHVKGAVQEKFDDSQDTLVNKGIQITSATAHIYIHTATSIQLHVGDSSIWMDSGGQISIKGNNIAINGKESVTIKGGMVRSTADSTHETEGGNVMSEAKGSNTIKGGMVMLNP